MDFIYPPEAEAFRKELRAWLDEHLSDDLRGLGFALEPDPERIEQLRQWSRLLADAGYAAISWPSEYGGRGATLIEQVVWSEEMHRAQAPPTLNPIGIANIAPAILAFGTEEQKQRHLPRMLRGDDIWCQGFSEPDAGSDLAALRTSAVRDGDHYVVTGQKVWNTLGGFATMCELLVRTDPEAPRHQGISCLLVDMSLPGIEARPLVTITAEREFSELFFTEVRVPVHSLLGPENDGWQVAVTTLAHERGSVADLHLGLRRKVRDLVDEARTAGRIDHPLVRHRLADVYLRAELLKLLADRAVSGQLHGRPMGPESSVAKLLWSDTEQRLAEVAGEVLGAQAIAGRWGRERVYCRALSIAGGTTEVQKNIIAQRILGLPRG